MKNGVRRLTAVWCAAVAISATTFIGLPGAALADTPYDPRKECAVHTWRVWGQSCDGWVVTVLNETNLTLLPFSRESLFKADPIYPSTQEDITNKKYSIFARGCESWLGGPANIRFGYRSGEHDFSLYLWSEINGSSRFLINTAHHLKFSAEVAEQQEFDRQINKFITHKTLRIHITQ